MINKRYSDEFKLQVIREYLNTSIGCRTLAKKYSLPSKNYIDSWKRQLLKKGLLSAEECNKSQIKTYSLNNSEKKTPYEKQLEKENLKLRAELAFYKELRNLINEDNKKK